MPTRHHATQPASCLGRDRPDTLLLSRCSGWLASPRYSAASIKSAFLGACAHERELIASAHVGRLNLRGEPAERRKNTRARAPTTEEPRARCAVFLPLHPCRLLPPLPRRTQPWPSPRRGLAGPAWKKGKGGGKLSTRSLQRCCGPLADFVSFSSTFTQMARAGGEGRVPSTAVRWVRLGEDGISLSVE